MNKIAKGWQYQVYDLENGRVRKKTYPAIIQYWYILRTNYFYSLKTKSGFNWDVFVKSWRNMQRSRAMEKTSNDYIKSILFLFDSAILGNPLFLSNGYEQDRATVLDNIFKGCSFSEGKRILDGYVALIQITWTYGFADTVFNFTVNNSLNSQSNVIQIDFGELTFNKSDVGSDIVNKSWLKNASYNLFPPGELKDYFCEIMNRELTLERLDRLWGIKLNCQYN